MKTKILTFTILSFLLIFQACKKDDIEENNSITMEIDGKNFKSVSIDNFDNLSDSINWNIYPGGTFLIDTINKFNGNSSVNLKANGECFQLEKIEGIPVNKEKIYVIHFHYKLLSTQIGEVGHCVGDFMIRLKQGDETIFLDGCSGVDSWTEKYFYFQPINNIPVKIELLVGTEHGIWLDDLIVFQEL
ncbi:MAG: hypothetical protein DRJ01_10185 [Bacteroidetes bacterium]|nr:MAG: hypothetical protein DRJ01_10185 [Bacteroidota bacterium]